MTTRSGIWLLSLAALWGGSFFFTKVAVDELPPLTVVVGRVALAAIALNLVLAASSRGLFQVGTPWPAFFTMGLLNNLVPFALIFWAQTHIASGRRAADRCKDVRRADRLRRCCCPSRPRRQGDRPFRRLERACQPGRGAGADDRKRPY